MNSVRNSTRMASEPRVTCSRDTPGSGSWKTPSHIGTVGQAERKLGSLDGPPTLRLAGRRTTWCASVERQRGSDWHGEVLVMSDPSMPKPWEPWGQVGALPMPWDVPPVGGNIRGWEISPRHYDRMPTSDPLGRPQRIKVSRVGQTWP